MEWLKIAIPRFSKIELSRYFSTYDALRDIQNPNHRAAKFRYKLLQFNNLVWNVHYIVLLLVPHSFYAAVINVDPIQVFGLPHPWTRILYSWMGLMGGIFTYHLFYKLNPKLKNLIQEIMLHQSRDSFWPFFRYRNQLPSEYVQQKAFKLGKGMQIFKVACDIAAFIIWILANVYLIVEAKAYFKEFWPMLDYRIGGAVALLLWQLKFISAFLILVQLIYVFEMLIELGFVLLASVVIRFWQSRQILGQLANCCHNRQYNFFLHRFLGFARHNVVSLLCANRFVGNSFFIFLLFNLPLNGQVIMQVFFTHMDPYLIILNLILIIEQWCTMIYCKLTMYSYLLIKKN